MPLGGELLTPVRSHHRAVAQHHDVLAQSQHISAGCARYRSSTRRVAQARHQRKQRLRLARAEGSSGLVENHQPRPEARAPWRSRPAAVRRPRAAPPASREAGPAHLPSSRAVFRRAVPRSIRNPALRGNAVRNRFSAMVRLGKRFSSWWMKAMPAAGGLRRVPWRVRAAQRADIRPDPGWRLPPRMFIRVDLPAPFSPTARGAGPAGKRKADVRAGPRTAPKLLLRWTGHSIMFGAVPERVEQGGEQDDAAFDHHDGEVGEIQQVQAVVDQLEEQHAEQGPEDLALARRTGWCRR